MEAKQKKKHLLKSKLGALAEEALDYAQELKTSNWLQLCESISDQLHTASVWQILWATSGQAPVNAHISQLQLSAGFSDLALTTELHTKFFSPKFPAPAPDHPKSEPTAFPIDAGFSIAELRTFLS